MRSRAFYPTGRGTGSAAKETGMYIGGGILTLVLIIVILVIIF